MDIIELQPMSNVSNTVIEEGRQHFVDEKFEENRRYYNDVRKEYELNANDITLEKVHK
jgi:hypothetical protein